MVPAWMEIEHSIIDICSVFNQVEFEAYRGDKNAVLVLNPTDFDAQPNSAGAGEALGTSDRQ